MELAKIIMFVCEKDFAHGSFHAEIVVDTEKLKKETANYQPIPTIVDFTDPNGNDLLEQEIQGNYSRIKQDVAAIVENEMSRIKNDPKLVHLVQGGE